MAGALAVLPRSGHDETADPIREIAVDSGAAQSSRR
jgi:hypothetical protein